MKKIGVTGGIGSGKTLVCSIIEHLGFPVFYSDKVAKTILDEDEELKFEMISIFGMDVYLNNQLNRPYLAQKIFSDKQNVGKVNALVHPRVRKSFDQWAAKQKSNLVFNEAAILFETGAYKNFDATILVTAPEELRIRRVQKRDETSESEIISRIKNQWTEEQKIPLATYVIQNDDQHAILEQVERIIVILDV